MFIFVTGRGSEYRVLPGYRTKRQKRHSSDAGIKPESEITFFVDSAFANAILMMGKGWIIYKNTKKPVLGIIEKRGEKGFLSDIHYPLMSPQKGFFPLEFWQTKPFPNLDDTITPGRYHLGNRVISIKKETVLEE